MTRSTTLSTTGKLTISARGLKGKQSVRATFRLPETTIQLLGIVASQLGLKQKSLFDQLIEDREILSKVAKMADATDTQSSKRRQKTFVLSKKSLEVLNSVARQQKIPRDLLVEISIRRLLPIMHAEQEKHEKRVRVHKEMKACHEQCRKLQKKTGKLLGKEDRAYLLSENISNSCASSIEGLEAILKNSKNLEKHETVDLIVPFKEQASS